MKTLKNIATFILLGISLINLSSCEKVKDLAASDVTLNLPQQHFTFSGSSMKSGDEVVLYSNFVEVNLDSILNAEGISSGSLTATTFTTLSITMEQPVDSTFHWMSSMRAVVSDNENFSPEHEVGNAVNNDPLSKTLTVTLNNTNITQYLTQPSFWLRLYCTPTGPMPSYSIGMFMDGSVKLRITPF